MDRIELKRSVLGFFQKYKFAILIAAVGLLLCLIPERNSQTESQVNVPTETKQEQSVASQIEQILSQIQGAGQVQVLLTVSSGEQILYQTDTDANGDSIKTDTVIVSGSDRVESGLITQVIPPQYLGAIVVCQGADRASVKLAIVEAVSKVTGLGADRISVLKMK